MGGSTLHQIRLEHLQRLTEEHLDGDTDALARALGRPPAFVLEIRTGYRGMGDHVARELEEVLGLQSGGFDDPRPIVFSTEAIGIIKSRAGDGNDAGDNSDDEDDDGSAPSTPRPLPPQWTPPPERQFGVRNKTIDDVLNLINTYLRTLPGPGEMRGATELAHRISMLKKKNSREATS